MTENEIGKRVVDVAVRVHRELGESNTYLKIPTNLADEPTYWSPNNLNIVPPQASILTYQDQLLRQCLRYEHAIERIAMNKGQRAKRCAMLRAQRQAGYSIVSHKTLQLAHPVRTQIQFAKTDFYGHLPKGHNANGDGVVFIFQKRPGCLRKALGLTAHPYEGMSVHQ